MDWTGNDRCAPGVFDMLFVLCVRLEPPMSDLSDLREEYDRAALTRERVADDPLDQFRTWFEEAHDADLPEPNAMTLSTAAPDGSPSARIVLLKGVDERGFRFYTNYDSRKGAELAQNPRAALVFWWAPLERQVRVEGDVERLPSDESDAYFQSRPRGSQLGAWVSPQSRIIESREVLDTHLEEVKAKYEGEEIPRPSDWGGYVVRPTQIEFWQGRRSRLHDRLRYRRDDPSESWNLERLAP